MTYANTTELIGLLKREGLWAQKKLGQNFLVNMHVLDKIMEAADVKKNDTVIEVGPGLGILTERLIEKAGHVRSIELDPDIYRYLAGIFKGKENLELEKGNALRASLPNRTYKVVANIPYYITSPLLRHFLDIGERKGKQPSLLVLLVQKEVAQKICAHEGEQSIISLQVQVFGKPEIVTQVSGNSFFPAPKVDSAILKITVYSEPLLKDTQLFFDVAKRMFSQKRKTLFNILQNQLNLPRGKAEELLKTCSIEANRRPQTLTFAEWEKIVGYMEKMKRQI